MTASTAARRWRSPPELDRWPQPLALPLGPQAEELLRVVVEPFGASLRWWRPTQVTLQSGPCATVQYTAQVEWTDGRRTAETIVAATGGRIPDGAAVLESEGLLVGAWCWPHDPRLPGLTAAVNPPQVAALLADLGLGDATPRLQVRSYRPGRRAVIEATSRRGRVFIKAVPPAKVEALHRKHRLLAAHLPVPNSAGWSDDGLLVVSALPGTTLRRALTTPTAPLPEPATLWHLLERLPGELTTGATRRGPLAHVAHHAETVAVTLPALRPRIERLRRRLDDASVRDHPVVAVHGDYYEAQLLVTGGRVSGLLDVDTAGAGTRIDDMANCLAHLSVLGLSARQQSRLLHYGSRLLAAAERLAEPADLRWRIAAATLALATGPFRVLEDRWQDGTEARLKLAESWADSAERVARS